jgi:3-methyl-2-oxobutanoate hydroxymethyltransferase
MPLDLNVDLNTSTSTPSPSPGDSAQHVTAAALYVKKKEGRKISALTCYDYPTALIQDRAGIDILLIGDSVGTNVLGYRSAQEVTLEDILHHTRAVRRGTQRAFVLSDMPFMSYQPSVETALENAARLIRDGGADGVKLEGGSRSLPQTKALVQAGVATMGHLGYTPQSQTRDFFLYSSQRGTVPKFQGKGPKGARSLLDEALRLEDAGVFALILEQVVEEVAGIISERLSIPTIGIGSGRQCDGQVLICNDLMGLNPQKPLLARAYGELHRDMEAAFGAYRADVESGHFPAAENTQSMTPENLEKFRSDLDRPLPTDNDTAA